MQRATPEQLDGRRGSVAAQVRRGREVAGVYFSELKRPAKSARDRLAYLLRQAIKAEFESELAEPAAKQLQRPEAAVLKKASRLGTSIRREAKRK